MKRTTRNIFLPAVCLLATGFLALALSGSNPADPAPTDETAKDLTQYDAVPQPSALRASIDPETGKLRMGPAPVNELELDAWTANALRRDTEGLQPTYRSDGTILLNPEGRFQNLSVAHIDENGKLIMCSERADQVEDVLNGRVNAPTPVTQTPEVR